MSKINTWNDEPIIVEPDWGFGQAGNIQLVYLQLLHNSGGYADTSLTLTQAQELIDAITQAMKEDCRPTNLMSSQETAKSVALREGNMT